MKYVLLSLALPFGAQADPAIVENVMAKAETGGWTLSVTLRHADTGWEDYADAWRIELPDGSVVATRTLSHPHVTEQPFTRSLTGVVLPDGTQSVVIRPRTSPDGWSDEGFALELP